MKKIKVEPYIYNKKNIKNEKLRSNDEIFKESLTFITKRYCEESCICGLKNLVDDDKSNLERLIWKVTMILALIGSITLVWMTFDKYYKAPLVTTQLPGGVSVNDIIFPAIGVCSTNRISKKAVTKLANELLQEERNKRYNFTQMLTLLSGLGHMYNLLPDDGPNLSLLHQALGKYDMKNLLRSLTPRCEDFLIACLWNENIMNCTDLFDFRLTMNGYCCTFNYLRGSDEFFHLNINRDVNMYNYGNKSSFDFDQGLKILIRFNETDDFYNHFHLQGAMIQFSDAYDFPDDPSGSFAIQVVSPTVQVTVGISASLTEASRDIQHLPISLRKCIFYDESDYLTFYTFSDCLLKCRMTFLFDNCNCTPFNMPRMMHSKICDLIDLPCLKSYNAQSIAIRPLDEKSLYPELELDLVGGGIYCPMCYPACSKTAYSYDFKNINIHPDYLNSLPDRNRESWLVGMNFTNTSIVHVKYANEIADSFEQNVIMKWFDLFSNIGSTCGFVTGFSFISALEFIYFYTVKLMRDYEDRRCDVRMGKVNQNTKRPPLTGERSLYWNELTRNLPNNNLQII